MDNMWGQRIVELRERRGWTQEVLAEKSGLTRGQIAYQERGTWPGLDVITAVCKACGVELWEFFYPEDARPIKITHEQHVLLQAFEKIPDEYMKLILQFVKGLVVTLSKDKIH